MLELRLEAANAIYLKRATESGLLFARGVDIEDDAEEDREGCVAEIEDKVSNLDIVDREEEADLGLAESDQGLVIKEG